MRSSWSCSKKRTSWREQCCHGFWLRHVTWCLRKWWIRKYNGGMKSIFKSMIVSRWVSRLGLAVLKQLLNCQRHECQYKQYRKRESLFPDKRNTHKSDSKCLADFFNRIFHAVLNVFYEQKNLVITRLLILIYENGVEEFAPCHPYFSLISQLQKPASKPCKERKNRERTAIQGR